ncbi:MAG: hypothetical protein KJ630_13205 [Proteobacteria bacterium]|nr:hypothetical protein [Pseudomonadota bacterium]
MKRETINLNLKRFTDMGKILYQVILGELSLYSQCQKKEIYDEFRRKYPGRFCTTNLIVFLKEKLEIEEYWGNENWLKLWMGHYSLSDSKSRLDFPEISRNHLR